MKRNKLFLFFLSMTIASIVFGQATLSGTITSEADGPLEFALVTIPSLGLGKVTDEKGMYRFDNLPSGRHNVEVNYLGYDAYVSQVRIEAGQSATLDIQLNNSPRAVNEVVVTGVTNPKSSLESSISISTLKPKDIANAGSRTTAEIFRSIPGIRSESSGGEGNSNITVRGVPVSAGGSRYMLLQEDGLPVLLFGDVAFGTQDQFLRYDYSVKRLEAVRGGSASVLTSNSPAGIINLISNTGEVAGGSVGTSIGLDFPQLRTDFAFGSPIGNGLNFHVGGFYRVGDGPRQTGFTSNNGGQIKANLTKNFSNGFARIYVKYLNDRTAAYMPMPVEVSGTNKSPKWGELNAYDAFRGSLHSTQLLKDKTIGGDGNILSSDVADGMHSVSKSFGGEFNISPKSSWTLSNKFRLSSNGGQFIAPFPANVGNAASILGSIPSYKSAVYAGTTTAVDPNANYMRIHLFNTKLNDFNNFINDFSISKSFNKVKVNVGYSKSIQNISMAWHWNTYLMEVNSDKARMINVIDSAGNSLSPNGLLAYGVPAWGNCCNRNFDTKYTIDAPYGNVEITLMDNLNLDAGLRYDLGKVNGSFSGGNGQTAAIDMNGNGKIDANETAVASASSEVTPVDYKYNILSYSVGANYELNTAQSVFARVSKGGSASADRILFSGFNYTNTDDPSLDAQKVNTVNQAELGYKYRKNKLTLNATAFLANTKESNYEATTQKKIDNTYRSIGLELDGIVSITNNLNLRAGLTYTKGEITAARDSSIVGNIPRRLPAVMFNLIPSYSIGSKVNIGFALLGFTKSYAQDNNSLVMPGYLVLNPFINYNIGKYLSLNLSGNNVLNALGITESEEGSITENTSNIVRARPIPGRTFSFGVKYNF